MRDLGQRLNGMCDSQPFDTSWFVKDWRSGATADRRGDVAVPSARCSDVASTTVSLSPPVARTIGTVPYFRLYI